MDRVVVVTGGSAGLGRAIVQAFADRGDAVCIVARGRERLDRAVREVEAGGGRAIGVVADVADAEAVERAAERCERELGPIDVWVANAMTTIFAPFDQIEPAEFRRATDVTYHGVVWSARSALRRMKPRDRGKLIFVGSALAYRGIPLQAPYCGAKHAVHGVFESLRAELAHEGSSVSLTMVQMPALNTPQFDWGRSRMPERAQPVPPIFQPEVGADAVAWAADHDRREVFVAWPAYKTIWGNKVAPAFADRYLGRHGVSGQQTGEPQPPGQPDNLFEPVDLDVGAHGRFDDRSSSRSVLLAATKRRGWVAAAGLGLVGSVTAGVVRRMGVRRG
jgi:NAD(P)-dependent dehydrogenase (short-subunit alcohol dehydrogenase family)